MEREPMVPADARDDDEAPRDSTRLVERALMGATRVAAVPLLLAAIVLMATFYLVGFLGRGAWNAATFAAKLGRRSGP